MSNFSKEALEEFRLVAKEKLKDCVGEIIDDEMISRISKETADTFIEVLIQKHGYDVKKSVDIRSDVLTYTYKFFSRMKGQVLQSDETIAGKEETKQWASDVPQLGLPEDPTKKMAMSIELMAGIDRAIKPMRQYFPTQERVAEVVGEIVTMHASLCDKYGVDYDRSKLEEIAEKQVEKVMARMRLFMSKVHPGVKQVYDPDRN